MLVSTPSLEALARPWHAMTPGSVLNTLGASEVGLTTTAAIPRRLGSAPAHRHARDEGPVLSWRRAVANRAALGALVAGVLSMLAVVQIPALAHILRLVPFNASDWAVICGLALVPAVVGQTVKAARRWLPATGVTR